MNRKELITLNIMSAEATIDMGKKIQYTIKLTRKRINIPSRSLCAEIFEANKAYQNIWEVEVNSLSDAELEERLIALSKVYNMMKRANNRLMSELGI